MEFSKIPTRRYGSIRPDQLGKPKRVDFLEPNNQEKEINDAVWTALVETSMARDMRNV